MTRLRLLIWRPACALFIGALLATLILAAPLPAAAQPADDAPRPVIAQVDYMRVEPSQVDEYLSVERELFMPLHQARADDGRILGWQLYAVRYPAGMGPRLPVRHGYAIRQLGRCAAS